MADNINGPLHAERMGPTDLPLMVFVHPNPMDSAAWLFQMAHLSTWFNCVAVDLPGYGRSPTATDAVTMADLAQACWEAADAAGDGPAILVGCSIGAAVVQHMYHVRPEATRAVIVCGTGYTPMKDNIPRRIDSYREHGLDYRWDYTFIDFSEAFRQTPLARWFAELFTERNDSADLDSIIAILGAHAVPDEPWLREDLNAPVLIISGSEDQAHPRAFELRDRLPDAELVILEGAGHACNIERPWEFDTQLLEFLARRGLQQLPSRTTH